ncbi:MAG: NeuD/PglB/VioB family sugar acetyltransferase [Gallionella sp.]|nr:NeuD/PglB/VioB family sugar acetyltransferase [Gallionella sp.]
MKPKLILIGGGGHCASCIDVIEQEDKFEIAGIVDKDPGGKEILGYQILGKDDNLSSLRSSCDFALITVGQIRSPQVRIRLFEYAKSLGYTLPVIISPRAYVSRHASVGEGTIIMHDALINSRATIGSNCIINTKALIEHDAIVGDHCHISTTAVINGGGVVGQGTFVGSNAATREAVATKENDFIKAGSLFTGHAND